MTPAFLEAYILYNTIFLYHWLLKIKIIKQYLLFYSLKNIIDIDKLRAYFLSHYTVNHIGCETRKNTITFQVVHTNTMWKKTDWYYNSTIQNEMCHIATFSHFRKLFRSIDYFFESLPLFLSLQEKVKIVRKFSAFSFKLLFLQKLLFFLFFVNINYFYVNLFSN